MPWRQKIAKYLRAQEHSNPSIATAKYDVVISDLLVYLQHHPGTNQIIHGHTHLPSIQLIKSTENIWIKRFVLSDWHANRGNVLIANPDQTLSLVYFSQGNDKILSNFSHEF